MRHAALYVGLAVCWTPPGAPGPLVCQVIRPLAAVHLARAAGPAGRRVPGARVELETPAGERVTVPVRALHPGTARGVWWADQVRAWRADRERTRALARARGPQHGDLNP